MYRRYLCRRSSSNRLRFNDRFSESCLNVLGKCVLNAAKVTQASTVVVAIDRLGALFLYFSPKGEAKVAVFLSFTPKGRGESLPSHGHGLDQRVSRRRSGAVAGGGGGHQGIRLDRLDSARARNGVGLYLFFYRFTP